MVLPFTKTIKNGDKDSLKEGPKFYLDAHGKPGVPIRQPKRDVEKIFEPMNLESWRVKRDQKYKSGSSQYTGGI